MHWWNRSLALDPAQSAMRVFIPAAPEPFQTPQSSARVWRVRGKLTKHWILLCGLVLVKRHVLVRPRSIVVLAVHDPRRTGGGWL